MKPWMWTGIVICILAIVTFSQGGWRELMAFTPEEISEVNLNRSRYTHHQVAKLLENKGGIVATKLIDRTFTILDINRYLFAGHPREGAVYGKL